MFSFLKPPSKLSRISEDSNDEEDDFSLPFFLSFFLYILDIEQRKKILVHGKKVLIHMKTIKNQSQMYIFNFVSRYQTFRIYSAGKEGPLVFCIHGAGASGLSFTLLAVQNIGYVIKQKYSKSFCRIVAPDLRGHGIIDEFY